MLGKSGDLPLWDPGTDPHITVLGGVPPPMTGPDSPDLDSYNTSHQLEAEMASKQRPAVRLLPHLV